MLMDEPRLITQKHFRRPTAAVLWSGIAIRATLALILPADRAYDDHFGPVKWILEHKCIPSAADCWECFQPPLYYVISAGVFTAATGVAGMADLSKDLTDACGRKAMQLISLVAGGLTLWLCVLTLRRVMTLRPLDEAAALGVVAFLPAHVLMSAMATNDALTYLVATAAVYATICAQQRGWPTRLNLFAGALAGATVLAKAYGLMTTVAVVACVAIHQRFWTAHRPTPARSTGSVPRRWPAWLVIGLSAASVGIWPAVRNCWIYGRPHVDNYSLFDTPMRFQPPGSISGTSFSSFRLTELIANPWLHNAHAPSFWTQMYARLWFDYEGFQTSLRVYQPWGDHWNRCREKYPNWNRLRWRMLLDYAKSDVPADFARIGAVSYVAGLPLTIAGIVGLVLAIGRAGRDFPTALLTANFVLCACIPVVQTLRLPHFAAMKTAFALGGMAAAPLFVGLLLSGVRGRARIVITSVLVAALAVVALCDAAYVVTFARRL